MCYLRRRFEEQFADSTGRTYIEDTSAFYFDNIGADVTPLQHTACSVGWSWLAEYLTGWQYSYRCN